MNNNEAPATITEARDLVVGDLIAGGYRRLTQVTVIKETGVVAVYGYELDGIDGRPTGDSFGGEFCTTDLISVKR